MTLMKLLMRFLCLALAFGSLLSCTGLDSRFKPGTEVPETRFYLLDGSIKLTKDLKGKNVVVIFWATSCSHSSAVLEKVNKWLRANGQRYDVAGIAVSIDKPDQEQKMRARIADLKYLHHAFSGNDVYDEAFIAFDTNELPSVFVIGPDGKIKGADSSAGVLDEVFKR